MHNFELNQIVKVKQLLHAANSYNSWQLNKQRPSIGDIGILLEVLEASNGDTKYIVESLNIEGETLWLSEFEAEELESLT